MSKKKINKIVEQDIQTLTPEEEIEVDRLQALWIEKSKDKNPLMAFLEIIAPAIKTLNETLPKLQEYANKRELKEI